MRIIYIILLCGFGLSSYGQNHVPNASFEQYTVCPIGIGINYCATWAQYTTATTDYFHGCAGAVPNNAYGNEPAASGNAYLGSYGLAFVDYREYAHTSITPLQIGSSYEVSISVSLSDNSALGCDGMGVFFFDNGPTFIPTSQVLNVVPQVSYSGYGPITQKNGWVRLTGILVADSAYDNIVVGNFLPDNLITSVPTPPGTNNSAYYYIDSVVVKLLAGITINFTATSLCPGASVNVPYTIQNISFVPGNTFTLQLSDAAGSFASPVNIGSVSATTAGNISGVIPPGTPPGTGYKLRVVSSNPAHISNTTGNITINSIPAGITVGSNSPVCAGGAINLNSSSTTPGASYSWTGPGGYSTAGQNPTRANATVAMAGMYYVTATVNGCSSAPAGTNVAVNPIPAAPVAANNGPLCVGSNLNLSATGQPGATYQWNGPAGYNSNAQNPTLLGAATANAGSYSVTQTVNGCTSAPGTTSVIINNSVNPAIAVFPSPNDTICPGQAVVFVASPNNGGTAPQYQWKKNGNNITGATGATYNTSAINSGDFFSCEMVSSTACAFPQTVQSNNVLMTVEPPQPCAVSITANPGLVLSPWELVTFTATTVKGGILPSYQWLRNGKAVMGAVSSIWGANNLGSNDTISVVLFSTDPCALPNTDTSNYLIVNIKTGINDQQKGSGLILYPNPNNGDFTIKGDINEEDVQIEVFNALGQVVYSEKHMVNNSYLDHNIHLDVASGVYLLKVTTNNSVKAIRFDIKRK